MLVEVTNPEKMGRIAIADTAPSKELRLILPLQSLVNLHALKLLKNQSIRESVAQALDAYFAVHRAETMVSGDFPPL